MRFVIHALLVSVVISSCPYNSCDDAIPALENPAEHPCAPIAAQCKDASFAIDCSTHSCTVNGGSTGTGSIIGAVLGILAVGLLWRYRHKICKSQTTDKSEPLVDADADTEAGKSSDYVPQD